MRSSVPFDGHSSKYLLTVFRGGKPSGGDRRWQPAGRM
ncbi:hypothetical protein VT85_17555 [Planctomyces sp. SH-PL62]|nr:hypothetical protein VT85_17555 [Planctomyces sp. SH-PL62]